MKYHNQFFNFQNESLYDKDPLNEELCRLAFNVFSQNADGKKLLSYLRTNFIEQPVCLPGMAEGFGWFREGQNDLIRRFEGAIQHYLTIQEQNRE